MEYKYKRKAKNYDGTDLTLHHVKDILPSVLYKLEGVYKQDSHRILEAWPTVIGPRFSKMTSAESFTNGFLHVRVRNSTLNSLLQQHEKHRILSHLRKLFPGITIKTIIFRIG